MLVMRRQSRTQSRHGFTLVELLVAVGILVALLAITLVSVNLSASADRIKGTARQVQSTLAGARDRAIYSKSPVGVRLLLSEFNATDLDDNRRHQVTGLIYVGSPELFTDGTVTFDPDRTELNDTGMVVALNETTTDMSTTPTSWRILRNRELIGAGARIQIPRDTGDWYTVASQEFDVPLLINGVPAMPAQRISCLVLDRPCSSLAGSTAIVTYALELRPGVLPGAQPVAFPTGVVIDLNGSQVPGIWRPSGSTAAARFNNPYVSQMDIMFSPRGECMGDAAALGQIHLLLADLGDVEKWSRINGRNRTAFNPPFVPTNNPLTPDEPVVQNDQVVVTVATRTGRVSSHPVNSATVTPANLRADDPFAFAEIGEVATP